MLKTFLIVVAAVFLGFVLFVVALYFFIKHKLKTMFSGLGDALKGLAGAASMLPPASIKLVRADQLDWHHPADVAATTDALRALGFVDAGTFTAEGDANGIRVRGLAHEADRAYAAILDAPAAGPYLDLVSQYARGDWLTYSTSPETGLDRPPEKPIHRFTNVDPASLYRRFTGDREPIELVPMPRGEFAATVERYYAEEMDWRAERGGLTEEEVRRQAAKAGMPDIDADTIQQVRTMFLAKLNEGLEEKLREAFLAMGAVTAAEWDDLQHEVTFVHNRMPEEQVGGAFRAAIGYGDEVDGQVEALQRRARELGPRAAFDEANAALPADRRFTLLAELAGPIPCGVYRNPEEPPDDEDDD